MNDKLVSAEHDLLRLLRERPKGVAMPDVLNWLGHLHSEANIRAAVWTLQSEGQATIRDDMLVPE